MRILLLHNPKAGSEEHEGEDFIKALKKTGHKAIYQSAKKKGDRKSAEKEIRSHPGSWWRRHRNQSGTSPRRDEERNSAGRVAGGNS